MGKSHVAGRTSENPTPAQMKEFWSQVDSGKITKNLFQQFLRGNNSHVNYDLAAQLLEDDFITPKEIMRIRSVSYGYDQLVHFFRTFPTNEKMHICRSNGLMLIAGPPTAMNFTDIKPSNEGDIEIGYGDLQLLRAGMINDQVETDWLMLRKFAYPGSGNKSFDEQSAVLSGFEYIPNASEVLWGCLNHREITGESLYGDVKVRTSTIFDGRRVFIGSTKGKIIVGYVIDDYKSEDIGLAVAFKNVA